MDVLNSWTLAVVLVSMVFLWWRKKRHPRFPPGPTGLPFLGVIPYLNKNEPWRMFKQWSFDKYGPIMSVRIANRDVILLNTFEVCHQAFLKQGSQFSGRAFNHVLNNLGKRNGIALKDYDAVYKTHKQFALKALRGFGLGRNNMESIIKDEADHMIAMFSTKCDTTTLNIKKSMFRATANIISKMSIGRRFDYDDHSYDYFLDSVKNLFGDDKDGPLVGVLHIFDILRYVPPFKGVAKRYTERDIAITDYVRKVLKQHREDFDPNSHRDFMDAYIHEQQSGTGINNESFTDDQLIFFLRDLYIAGTETVTASVSWLVIVLLHHPEYYEKLMEEIEANVEHIEKLSMSMMKNMPFICAMMQEMHRFRTPTPTTLLHQTLEDCELNGYFIPKGITVIGNVWGVHNDPEVWKNPEQFDPYRHIDEDGKFIPSNKMMAFSLGPRTCPGESLARHEFFLFTVKLLYTFKIMPDENGLPSLQEHALIVSSPSNYEVRLQRRE